MRDEIIEERRVTIAALGMILHGKRERIIAQPHLLDDVVRPAPGFHLEAITEAIDRLMM